MDFTCFLKGLIIGFVLPIPIGPVGILCIRRTLAYGKYYGFLTGLSAAISDMMLSIVAAFGITLVSNYISGYQQEIRLFGGVVLLAIGYLTLRPHPIKETAVQGVTSPALSFFSTFLITFTNPMAVFAYAAVFAGIGVDDLIHNHTSASLVVIGVFVGSLCWFSVLIYLSSIFKEKIISRGLVLVNKITGSLLMLFGLIALLGGLNIF
jgi:threonine/homoserine/homoserine lactone efflux protein